MTQIIIRKTNIIAHTLTGISVETDHDLFLIAVWYISSPQPQSVSGTDGHILPRTRPETFLSALSKDPHTGSSQYLPSLSCVPYLPSHVSWFFYKSKQNFLLLPQTEDLAEFQLFSIYAPDFPPCSFSTIGRTCLIIKLASFRPAVNMIFAQFIFDWQSIIMAIFQVGGFLLHMLY